MRKTVVVVVALVALVAALGATAFGHAHLSRSAPANNAELSAIPQAICLWFTEPIEKALSSIEVKDAQGNRVDDLDKWRASEEAKGVGESIAIPLKPIGPGEYTVTWRVLSIDTHSSRGEFRFTVLPGAEAAGAAESEGSAQIRCDVPVS